MSPFIPLFLFCALISFKPALSTLSAAKYQTQCAKTAASISGVVVPVFTAYDKNGNLNTDPKVIGPYAKMIGDNNASAVIVNSPIVNGRYPSRNDRSKQLKAWVVQGKTQGFAVIAAIDNLSLGDTVNAAKNALLVKADAVITLPPLFLKVNTSIEAVRILKLVADACYPLPLYVYVPDDIIIDFKYNLAKFFNLAKKMIVNFGGIKCSFVSSTYIVSTCNISPCQNVISFGSFNQLAAYVYGVNSTSTPVANIFLAMVTRIRSLVLSGCTSDATSIQLYTNQITNALMSVIGADQLDSFVYTTSYQVFRATFRLLTSNSFDIGQDPVFQLADNLVSRLRQVLQRYGLLSR